MPSVQTLFYIALSVVAGLLILVILMQNRASGLSATFGGTSFVSVKRGPEKFIARLTVILAVLFLVLTVLQQYWQPLVRAIQASYGA